MMGDVYECLFSGAFISVVTILPYLETVNLNRNPIILYDKQWVSSFPSLLVFRKPLPLIVLLNGFNKDEMPAIKRTVELYLKDCDGLFVVCPQLRN